MKKKKALFLITKATWGGAQRYVYDLATHLPPDEFEPIVAYGEHGRLAEMLEKKNIVTRHLPALGRDVAFVSDVASFFQIFVCLWRVRPDVVHLNSSKAAALGALAARLMRIPRIVFTVHGWPFNEKRGTLARWCIYYISMFTALLSHSVIVVSKSDKAQVDHIRRIREKTHYIPIGIQPPKLLPHDEALQFISAKIPDEGFRKSFIGNPSVVTIAELTPNKGIRYAIEAVAQLKKHGVDVSYTVISGGEERERLQTLTQTLNVADRIFFAGFISDASKYLRAFDIFLLPSIKEGMPYVLLEAAAAGLPIITTNVVNPDVIERYQNIRAVPPADPEAIAEAVLETIREKSETEQSQSQNHFPLSEMIQKTISLYQ